VKTKNWPFVGAIVNPHPHFLQAPAVTSIKFMIQQWIRLCNWKLIKRKENWRNWKKLRNLENGMKGAVAESGVSDLRKKKVAGNL
jgi:hypothetical protein